MQLNGDAGERRRRPHEPDAQIISRRSLPTVYIVDEHFRVLHWHLSPTHRLERRAHCKVVTAHGHLQPAVMRIGRTLLAANKDAHEIASAVIQNEFIVRLAPLESSGGPATFAVFVEPYKARDHLARARERFKLTPREAQVLELLIAGARTREVASKLVIAETTAIFHVKQLFEKSGARNRMELISRAIA